jgi:hypothetical protein
MEGPLNSSFDNPKQDHEFLPEFLSFFDTI